MSKEFDFYGEESEKEEIREVRGITDTVSRFVYSDMDFPCICLKDDLKLPKHKWMLISTLVKQGNISKTIPVYLIRNGDLFKVGALSTVQIKSFIDVVGLDNMFGFYNKDKKLEGDRLYILSC